MSGITTLPFYDSVFINQRYDGVRLYLESIAGKIIRQQLNPENKLSSNASPSFDTVHTWALMSLTPKTSVKNRTILSLG
jgi:hypothetical protein